MGALAAVILAAGGSTRFGQAKQLLVFRGETLVRRLVRAATQAGCSPIVVVAGEEGEQIADQLRDLSVAFVTNAQWPRGIGTSVRCGVQHLIDKEGDLAAVVLLACDQPLVDANTIIALIRQHEISKTRIVASRYAGTLGIPALFDRSCFQALVELPDASGAKPFIESHGNDVVAIDFADGAIDIDTPGDLERLRLSEAQFE